MTAEMKHGHRWSLPSQPQDLFFGRPAQTQPSIAGGRQGEAHEASQPAKRRASVDLGATHVTSNRPQPGVADGSLGAVQGASGGQQGASEGDVGSPGKTAGARVKRHLGVAVWNQMRRSMIQQMQQFQYQVRIGHLL